MADNLSIIIQALIEKASTEAIKSQIDELQKYADTKKINLSLDINNSEFKSFVANLDKISTNMSKALSINADTSGLNKVAVTMNTTNKEMAFMEKRVKETTNAMGQLVKETSKFKQEANAAGDPVLTLTKRTEETVSNFEKQRKEQQKALEAQEKLEQERYIRSWTAKIKEIEDRNKLQLKVDKETEKQEQERYVRSWMAKIKEVEERNKQTQKNLTDLTNFQQKMLGGDGFKGELDIFAEKQKGRFETAALEKLRSQIKALNVDTPELQQNIKKLGTQFSSLKQQAAQSGSVMSRAFENAFKFLRFYLVGGAIVKFTNALKGVVDIVKQLDEALVETNKILDLSSSQLQKLSQDATNLGIAYGKTTVEVINSISAFAKAGLDETVSKQFAELAMLLSNVGDVSVETAQKTLIMANAGYQLGNDYATLNTLISQFNELANKNAVDVQFLSEAWQNSASVARQAKFDIEDYNAVLTVAGAVSQKQGAEVGNALRTWIMRLQGVTDGSETLEEDISKVDKVLSELGIQLRKSPTEFKPIMENLAEIAKKYRELGEAGESVKQAEMLEAMAGKHRANIIAGLLDNFEMINKTLDDQANSYKSAEKENAIYMDSIAAKTGALKAQWELFASNTLDSGLIKSFIDLGRVIIQVIDSGFARFLATTSLITLGVAGLAKVITLLATSSAGTAIGVFALDVASKGLLATTKALTTSLLASPLFWVAIGSLAIVSIIKLVDKLNVSMSDLSDTVNESYSKSQDNITQLKTWSDEYQQLAEKTDLNREEKVRLLEIENQLKTRFGETAQQIDLQNGSLETNVELINQLTQEEAKRFTELNKLNYNKAQDFLKGSYSLDVGMGTSFQVEYESIEKAIEHMRQMMEENIDNENVFNAYKKALEELYDELDSANDIVAKYEGYQRLLGDTTEETTGKLKEQAGAVKSLEQVQKDFDASIKSYQDVSSSIQSLLQIQKDLNESNGVTSKTMDEIISKHPELIQYLGDRATLETKISELIVTQEQVQRQAYTNMLMNSQTYFNEQIKGNKTLWNTIVDAYGKDAENFKSLAEAKDKTDVFLVNAVGERWKKLYGTQANALRALINASDGFTTSNIRSEKFALKNPAVQKQLSDARKQLKALEAIQKALNFSAKTVNFKGVNLDKIKGGSGSSSASKAVKEAYKPIVDAYQQISVELERINSLLEENSILTEQAEGSDKIALLQKRIALIKQQESALKKLNVQQEKELKVVKSSLKSMGFKFDSSNNLTNYAQRLSKLTGDTAKRAEELIDRFVELSTSAIPDTNNEILKLKNSIKSIGAEIDTYITDTFDQFYNFLFHNIDEEIKKLEESKAKAREVAEAKIAAIQAEIDQLQEKNEAQKIEEERTKRLMNLAKQREKLANIQNNRDTMLYNADGTASLVANPQKVREETEKLMELEEDYYNWEEDLRNQEQIKKLQDKITALQDELKNQEKGYDDQIKALQTFLEEQKDILSGANDFQIANAKALMKALAGIDAKMYAGRLEALNDFVNSYNNLMSNTVSRNSKIPKITPPKPSPTPTPKSTPSPSPTPSSGSSSVGKVSKVQGSLKKGAKGANVKLLQQALVGLGYSLPKYGIDGSFGGETLAAVMQFQKDMGLVVDGSVGAKTKAKFKLKGYATGGINDSPGMYELHGTKSQPEAIFNTKQLNSLFKILNGIRVPQFELPSLVGASASGGASNIYNFSIGSVQTNDAGGFLDNLKNLANKK